MLDEDINGRGDVAPARGRGLKRLRELREQTYRRSPPRGGVD